MKICMLTNTHDPLDHRIFYKESLSLKKKGYSIVVIGVGDEPKRFHKCGIDVIRVKRYKRFYGRIFSILFMLPKAINVKANVYHCHDLEAGILGVFLKFLLNARLVFDVHEYNAEIISESIKLPKFLKSILYKLVRFFDKLIAEKSDYIIVVTEELSNEYKKINLDTIQISNFVSLKNFLKNKLMKNNEEKYIIYIGGLLKERGIFEIIRCVDVLKKRGYNEKVVIVGSFLDEADKLFAFKLIKNLNLERNIEFVGKVPYEIIPLYLKKAKIGLLLLHPTKIFLKTTYPVKLFEYMYFGLPVIASDFPGIHEIISEEKCGILVNPLDVEEISNAITFILENPKEAKKIGDNGRNAVLMKYNWEREKEKLYKIYHDILKK